MILCVCWDGGRGEVTHTLLNSLLNLAGGKHIKASCLVSCQLAPPIFSHSLSSAGVTHACLSFLFPASVCSSGLPVSALCSYFLSPPLSLSIPRLDSLTLNYSTLSFLSTLSLSLSAPFIHRFLGQLPGSNIKR